LIRKNLTLVNVNLSPFDLRVEARRGLAISLPISALIAHTVFFSEYGHTDTQTQTHRRNWTLYPRHGYYRRG